MKNLFMFTVALSISLTFIGCGGSGATPVNVKSVGASNANSVDIKLPKRYSVEEFKAINMVTQFDGDKDTKEIIDLLETDVMKIKKFAQYARHFGDRANLRDEMHREDSGADIEASKVAKKPDYILAVKVNKTKTSQKLSETDEVLQFTVELKYQINREKDNKNVASGVIKGKTKRYKQYAARWNKRLRRNFYDQTKGHGFNGTELKDDEDAFRQASRRASKTLQYRLGNSFPAGGMIGMWREAGGSHQIKIDSGLNQGVMEDQYMVVYTNDSGIDTPVALTKVEALSEEGSVLSLVSWKDDPFSQQIINGLKKSNYKEANTKDFYAVAIAMPDPKFD